MCVCVCVCVCVSKFLRDGVETPKRVSTCNIHIYIYIYILQALPHVSVSLHHLQGALILRLLKLQNTKITTITY